MMNKFFIIILILIFPLLCIAQNDVSIGIAYDWDQLKKSDQQIIESTSEKYLTKLSSNEMEEFWRLCHSNFKESTSLISFKEIGTIISEMIKSTDDLKFIDAKKVVYSNEPSVNKFSTGGSIDKKHSKYLQFYTFVGIKNQVIALYEIKTTPLSKVITMKFGLENGDYKLTSIEINTNSILRKDSNYYIQIANEWGNKKSKLPKLIALSMSYRLSYLGRGTSTGLSLNVMDTLQKLLEDVELVSEIKKWDIKDSIFEIINIDFLETKSDITPNILYISKLALGEENTKKEADTLFKYFKNKYPDLVKEFGTFIFTAYEEYPKIQTKEYKYFRVVMND